MPDDLKQQLEQAQADYQKLYSQYQEELASIARWQQRMKNENETLKTENARMGCKLTSIEMLHDDIDTSEAIWWDLNAILNEGK